MRSRIVESFILAVALIIFGAILYSAVVHVKDRDRTVFVRGLAEREVPANFVIWPIVYRTTGDDLTKLYEDIQNKNKILEAFLLEHGIQKGEINYATPEVNDMQLDYYGDKRPDFRYSASVVVTVSSNNVANVREVMSKESDLLKNGIALMMDSFKYQPVFSFTALNEVKPAMIEEATRNARESAIKFAKDSHSSLGKIKNASQGQFTINNRDDNTPYIKVVRVVTGITYFLED